MHSFGVETKNHIVLTHQWAPINNYPTDCSDKRCSLHINKYGGDVPSDNYNWLAIKSLSMCAAPICSARRVISSGCALTDIRFLDPSTLNKWPCLSLVIFLIMPNGLFKNIALVTSRQFNITWPFYMSIIVVPWPYIPVCIRHQYQSMAIHHHFIQCYTLYCIAYCRFDCCITILSSKLYLVCVAVVIIFLYAL